MNTPTRAVITAVAPGSIAAQVGLRAGDEVVEINGKPLVDVLQWQTAVSGETLTLGVAREGVRTDYEIEKDLEDELGIDFDADLFDGIRRCKNNCVFCFVYQNPRALRKSLYIKDEDFRYSFMHGNYLTLTNLSAEDKRRIVDERLSPLYVSVHATDHDVRSILLGRHGTEPILDNLAWLAASGIDFYTQLVLCPGLNDGKVLERTLDDLAGFVPRLKGITAVPVGLTRYRDFLFPLQPFTRETAGALLDFAHARQQDFRRRHGTRLFFVSDEFYLLADRPLPGEGAYEGYHSLQDGVGMITRFVTGFKRVLPRVRHKAPHARKAGIVTGQSAALMFERDIFPSMAAAGWPIPRLVVPENRFYGPHINVAGLLTGADVAGALASHKDLEFAMICDYALKTGTEIFLDDVTLSALASGAGYPVLPVTDSPADMLWVLREGKPTRHRRTRSGWEAETPADGSDRYHPASAMGEPLFNRPNALWERLRTGASPGKP